MKSIERNCERVESNVLSHPYNIAPAPPTRDIAKKNVPQPANPLKSFNWSKLPDAKVQGTVWSELDDSKWYNNMELEAIDKLFSAYQKNGVAVCYELRMHVFFVLVKEKILFLTERWLNRRSEIDGKESNQNSIRHRWTSCTELYHFTEQIEDERRGNIQVRF